MGAYTDVKELIQDIITLTKTIENSELKNKILDLQNQFYDYVDENRELRLENEELKNIKITKDNLEWKNNAYIKKGTQDEIYCPRCLDDESKLIRMQLTVDFFTTNYTVVCPKCRTKASTDIEHGVDTKPGF